MGLKITKDDKDLNSHKEAFEAINKDELKSLIIKIPGKTRTEFQIAIKKRKDGDVSKVIRGFIQKYLENKY